MARWYQSRWWYVERPVPLPLIVGALVVVALVVWVLCCI